MNRTKKQPFACPAQHCLPFDNAVCMSGEVMFDICGLDDRTAFKRHAVLSSDSDSIAKVASTLP